MEGYLGSNKSTSLLLIHFILVSLVVKFSWSQYCQPIRPPPYGYLIRPCGTSVGDNCNIDCEIGFDIVGPSYRLCRANGTWSGTDTLCVRPTITCPMLRITTSGLLVRGCQNVAGGMCNFQCSPGFILQGDRSIFCRTDGTWSGSLPSCRSESCPPPPPPPVNGGYSGGGCSSQIGSFCTYQCNQGFALAGSPQIQCLNDGRWSGRPPQCQQIPPRYTSCSPLFPPDGGSITGNCGPTVAIDDECRFACDPGYILDGRSVLTCRANGKWSSEPPSCIKAPQLFCPPINPGPGIYTSGQCNPGIPGQMCNLACPKGSMLIGSPQILCQSDGRWNSGIPHCQTTNCPSLAPPSNGQISGSCGSGSLGQECNFFCAPGFNLLGSPKLRCQNNGQWSSMPPNCIPSGCSELQVPLGGIYKSTGNCSTCPNTCPGEPGQVCTLFCGRGFKLSGGQTSTCNPSTRRWEPEPATCVRERYVP